MEKCSEESFPSYKTRYIPCFGYMSSATPNRIFRHLLDCHSIIEHTRERVCMLLYVQIPFLLLFLRVPPSMEEEWRRRLELAESTDFQFLLPPLPPLSLLQDRFTTPPIGSSPLTFLKKRTTTHTACISGISWLSSSYLVVANGTSLLSPLSLSLSLSLPPLHIAPCHRPLFVLRSLREFV